MPAELRVVVLISTMNIAFSEPLVLLLLVPAIALTVWLWRQGSVNLGSRRRWAALVLRSLILFSLILALAGPSLRLPQSREAIAFLADLSASNATNRSAIQAEINRELQQRPGEDVAGVVTVGGNALVEQPISRADSFNGFQTAVDQNYTNLQSGLELAAATLPDGYRKRVVVLTDGQQNVGDALTAVRLLKSEGIRVDVVPSSSSAGADVRVDGVNVPSQLSAKQHFQLRVSVHSTLNTRMRLDIYLDRGLESSHGEQVLAGENRYAFTEGPLGEGFHSYRVQISPQVDSQPQNNAGSAFTAVGGQTRVLIISSSINETSNVAASLRANGTAVDVQTPDKVDPTLGYLQRYSSIVIVDTAAPVLGDALLAQLVPYVRDLGRGLVVIGGQESYGLGAYGQTPLEQVLPVKMDIPRRKDVPTVAVVLVIESLEETLPINISKEAGQDVVKLLSEQDQIAVNPITNGALNSWAVPMQHPRDKAAIEQEINQMQPGDPVSYVPTLQSAFDVLQHNPARVKHIIFLGDGDAADTRYEGVVKKLHAAGITLSTVLTNGQSYSDFQTMKNLAKWGGGRYYRADNQRNIPRVFLKEARQVSRSGIVQGKFVPQKVSSNPMLRDLHHIPPLSGYVVTAAKTSGEMELVSRKLDPILAGWQFGSGRSVAWTSDAAGLWTRDWLSSPDAGRFWSDLVSWTLPANTANHLFVSTSSTQGQARISVDTPSVLGANPAVNARIVDPRLHTSVIHLQPSSPGQYRGGFFAPAEGAYLVSVDARGAGHAETGQAGLDVPYSAEYRVGGTNTRFLQAMAHAGGGAVGFRPGMAWADNLSAVFDQRDLTALFWLLALLLFPFDIAARRLVVGRRDLDELWAAMTGREPATRNVPGREKAPVLREAFGRSPRWAGTRNYPAVGVGAKGTVAVPLHSGNTNLRSKSDADRASREPSQADIEVAVPAETTVSALLAAKRRRR